MRQALNTTLVIAAAAIVAACATGRDHPSYAEELAALDADCRERGGILTPIQGSVGFRPANDYACTIPGGAASRLD